MKALPQMLCGLVAASVLSAGCVPQPDSTHIGRSAEEVQQIINVTDSAIRLVRHLADGETAASGLQTEIRPLVTAIETASAQIRRHSAATWGDTRTENWIKNRSDVHVYSYIVTCARYNFIQLLEIDRHIKKLEDATSNADAAAFERQRQMLVHLAKRAADCALEATTSLRSVEGLDAVEHIGIVVGEVYAIATAFYAVSGLSLERLLKRQIVANEAIVLRLAPRCERRQSGAPIAAVSYPCVSHSLAMDALPKLKTALSRVSSERPSPSTSSVTNLDEISRLIHVTDSTIRLVRALPEGPLSAELQAAIRQVAAGIEAVDSQLLRHAAEVQVNHRAAASRYARTRACIESKAVLFPNLETFMQRWHEARLKADEMLIEGRWESLKRFALDLRGDCYGPLSVKSLVSEDPDNNLGILFGELYAMQATASAMIGLYGLRWFESDLALHIKTQEAIVTRLAARCEKHGLTRKDAAITRTTHPCAAHTVAADALPKLRSALAYLKESAARPLRFNPCDALPARSRNRCELDEHTLKRIEQDKPD